MLVRKDEPKRTTTILVPYTEYEWWLMSWEDNKIECRLLMPPDFDEGKRGFEDAIGRFYSFGMGKTDTGARLRE